MGNRTDLFMAVHGLINSSLSSYGASTSSITLYGGYPDIESPAFPCVIIEPVQVNEVASTKTIDHLRNVSSKIVPVIIHIYAKRNRDLDIIADGINGTLTTSIPGFLLNDTSDQNGFMIVNDQKIKGKTLTCTYLQR